MIGEVKLLKVRNGRIEESQKCFKWPFQNKFWFLALGWSDALRRYTFNRTFVHLGLFLLNASNT